MYRRRILLLLFVLLFYETASDTEFDNVLKYKNRKNGSKFDGNDKGTPQNEFGSKILQFKNKKNDTVYKFDFKDEGIRKTQIETERTEYEYEKSKSDYNAHVNANLMMLKTDFGPFSTDHSLGAKRLKKDFGKKDSRYVSDVSDETTLQTELDSERTEYELDSERSEYDDVKNDISSTGKLTFRPLLHQPRIYYGAPPGVHVTTIHAYNPERPRSKVEYSLTDILDYKTFVIDQISGNLTTAEHIDRRTNETYEVMVTAISNSYSELEHIQIAVTEFNQYAPRFDKRNYTVDIHPKADVNTTVLKVKAIDPDPTEENAEIYYKMDQNLTSKYFNLNYVTGDLILTEEINESDSTLCFGIFAEDGGSPKRWDYVPVYIHLKNISAPLNLEVLNISHSSASVCWVEPYYGDVLGYTISYRSLSDHTEKNVNTTVDYDLDVCHLFRMLDDETEYVVQIHGWNENEKGQLSPPVVFKTLRNWCKNVSCQTGSCEPILEEPWYICHCESGYYGPFCEFFNPCEFDPCGSNGECINITNNEYMCVCTEDYFGPNCSVYNPCERQKDFCENGGTCKTTVDKKMACVCPEGFGGEKCNVKDFCFINICLNGGTCQKLFNTSVKCICPPGFQGEFCHIEVNYCESNPCSLGSTCISNRENYTCVCPPDYFGVDCSMLRKCAEDSGSAMDIWYTWNATNVGTKFLIKCPFGSIESLPREGFIKRPCILQNGEAIWGEIDVSECRSKEVLLEEITSELESLTRNPESLNADTLETASGEIFTVAAHTKDKKIAQNVVEVISNVLEINETVLEETDSETFDSLRKSIDILASNVELEPGERLNLNTENVRVESLDWNPETEVEMFDDHIELTAPMFRSSDFEDLEDDEDSEIYPSTYPSSTEDSLSPNRTSATSSPNITEGITTVPFNVTGITQKPKLPVFQVFVPKEALQEAHRQLERSVRLKFVVYYSNKMFQPKYTLRPTDRPKVKKKPPDKLPGYNESVTTEEPPLKIPVLQISVGNIEFKNLQKPLVYILPMITSRKATCVFWNERGRQWSTEGLETEQTIDKVICMSSHMTAFSVLLDLDPSVQISELDNTILSIMSYVGSALSITGLTATLVTYSLFKCLNRDHTGQILINLSFSLLMMNIAFLTGSSNLINTKNACGIIAILIHYFVMASLSWMCAEAVNMYQLLVHVFATSETHFMLRRLLMAWGAPLAVVSVSVSLKFDAYRRNPDACVMSSYYPWLYYSTFMAPCCILLLANLFVFFRVSRVIFTPKLTVRASSSRNARITATQVRGAFTVMILLGTTWVFGTLAFGRAKVVFQYLFCITNSLQGFLIFIVRCLLYPEAKNAWIYLFRTGKFKTHRGTLPPGIISYSSSGFRSGLSPNTTGRTDSSDEPHSSELRSSIRPQQACRIVRNSPRTMSFRARHIERHPNVEHRIRRSPVERIAYSDERNRFYRDSSPHSHHESIEMQRRREKKCEQKTFRWRQPSRYYEERRFTSPSRPRKTETFAAAEVYVPAESGTGRLKKQQNIDANKDNLRKIFEESRRDTSRSINMPSIFQEIEELSDTTVSRFDEGVSSTGRAQLDTPAIIVGDERITEHSSSNIRRKDTGRQKALTKDIFCLDVDEGVHSDGSSSTEVDDGQTHTYKKSPSPRKKE